MSNWIRIATEEAFATPELFDRYRALLASGWREDPGFVSLWGFYLLNPSPRITPVIARMTDLGARRLGDMDATGIARQVLSLAAPGVQIFDADTAVGLARDTNDALADAVRAHPDRFSGLAAIAPQAPSEAAKEVERSVYEDPNARPSDLMNLRDVRSGRYEYREAVLRGLKRRGLQSPVVADMARALESAPR